MLLRDKGHATADAFTDLLANIVAHADADTRSNETAIAHALETPHVGTKQIANHGANTCANPELQTYSPPDVACPDLHASTKLCTLAPAKPRSDLGSDANSNTESNACPDDTHAVNCTDTVPGASADCYSAVLVFWSHQVVV